MQQEEDGERLSTSYCPTYNLNSKALRKWGAKLPILYPVGSMHSTSAFLKAFPQGCPVLRPPRSYQARLHSCRCASVKRFPRACSMQLLGRHGSWRSDRHSFCPQGAPGGDPAATSTAKAGAGKDGSEHKNGQFPLKSHTVVGSQDSLQKC